MENRIEIKGLTKTYNNFELENVSFTVPNGAVLGLIGENGAGKSTTLKALLGLISRDGGVVEINGAPIENMTKKERQKIGVVLDDATLPDETNLCQLNKVMKNIFDEWDENGFFEKTRKFGLPQDKKLREFSKGMRMKASLAVALSHNAGILVLDEPTSGLDPVARDEILETMYAFIQDEQRSIVISSHITGDLEKLCDYIVFIHSGKVVLNDEKDKLLDEFAVIKCAGSVLAEIDKSAVVRIYKRVFGTDALVRKNLLPKGFECEKVTLEEIMLFYAKGESL